MLSIQCCNLMFVDIGRGSTSNLAIMQVLEGWRFPKFDLEDAAVKRVHVETIRVMPGGAKSSYVLGSGGANYLIPILPGRSSLRGSRR